MSDHAAQDEMPASHLIETTDEDGNTHIFEKLEVSNITEAIVYATYNKLI